MPTFLHDLISTTDERWKEVELLIDEADKHHEGEPMYDSLCRAASILMISHMEGFIKELARSLVDDLNRHLSFADFPYSTKEAIVCSYYSQAMMEENDFRQHKDSLIATLEQVSDFEASVDAFLFLGTGNKNPKPDMVKLVLSKFGVSDVFKHLHNSSYEEVFESRKAAERRLHLLHKVTCRGCENFPYTAKLTLSSRLSPSRYQGQTVWQDFLNNINSRRHQVVHGNTFENHVTVPELRSDVNKVRLFQLLVVYLVSAKLAA